MGARQKLNQFYVLAVLMAAAILGIAAGSWAVFIVTAAVGIGLSLHTGDIRPTGRNGIRHHGRKRWRR